MRVTTFVAALVAIVTPASAGTCQYDGSVPGTSSKTIPIAAGGHVFYVEDRDYADADSSGAAGGVWLFWETNGVVGLQRGGAQTIAENVPGTMPYIPKIPLIPPNAVFPTGVVLFPAGFGGASFAETLHMDDACYDEVYPGGPRYPPDTIVFGHHRMSLLGPG